MAPCTFGEHVHVQGGLSELQKVACQSLKRVRGHQEPGPPLPHQLLSILFSPRAPPLPAMTRLTVLPLLAALLHAVAGLGPLPSLPDMPADKTTPVHQRLSFNGPTAIAVGWSTYEKIDAPCVAYGMAQADLSSQACSTTSVTYDTARTWANLVIIEGLAPATTYYYKIASTNSTVGRFMTARPAGDKTAFKMNTLADLGLYGAGGYTTSKRSEIPAVDPVLNHTTIGRLANTIDDYEFIIHPGDFSYADDWIQHPIENFLNAKDAYTAINERFYSQLSPVTAVKPYMVSPGNHEATCQEIPNTSGLCPQGQHNFSDFSNRFHGMMPTVFPSTSSDQASQSSRNFAQSLAVPPFWYSFDYGMVHVVSINTETDFEDAPDQPGGSAALNVGPFAPDGQQMRFLDADLASVDRSVTPWIVVAGHRPWYTVGNSSGVCGPCQTAFEGVLYKYGVDVAVFGHKHNLQRFDPIYNGTVDPAGLTNPKAPAYSAWDERGSTAAADVSALQP